jgi:hypothetical protein
MKRNRNLLSLEEIKRIFPAAKLLNNQNLMIRSDLKKKQMKKKPVKESGTNNKLVNRKRLKSINSVSSDDEQILSNDETETYTDSIILPNIKVKVSPSNTDEKKKTVRFNEEISYFYQKSDHNKQLIGLHRLFKEF